MCLAAPGKIIKIDGKKATVKYPGQERYALIGDEKVQIGDNVLVQMGIIVQKITDKEADTAEKAWE